MFVCICDDDDVAMQEVMVAGGMESMSNAPFYISRAGPSYGGGTIMVRLHSHSAHSCLKYEYNTVQGFTCSVVYCTVQEGCADES